MKNKNVIVIALGSILALIFVVSSVLLIHGISQFSKVEKSLDRSVKTLRNYYARNPFPSAENVKREEANGEELNKWTVDLVGELREGQIEPIQKTPAQFLRLFSQKRDELKVMATTSRTGLSDDFAFGFERYAASGALPAPADVPRLAQQLVIADQICRIIFKSGATELNSFRREEFDAVGPASGSADASSGARVTRGRSRFQQTASSTSSSGGARSWDVSADAGVLGPKDLYARLRFGVTFEAREEALISIMDALASDKMFAVVSLLDVEKTGDDVTPPAKTDAKAALGAEPTTTPTSYPPRSQRLMCGEMLERPMRVTMEIDVYRFAELTSGKGA